MSDGFDEVYVDTRRQLRGVAESLIAGPQYRAAGTIRPAVRPDGFAGVTDGFAGVTDGVYEIVDPLPTDGAWTSHTMSTHSRRTSPISSNAAEGNCDGGIQQRLQRPSGAVHQLHVETVARDQ
jgi:hypothetical protein